MQRRWSINGRFYSQPVTGVQRYAREILLALDALLSAERPNTDELAIELLVPPNAIDIPKFSRIKVKQVGTVGGHLWEQLVLPRYVRARLVSLCNTGPILTRNHIVCIHDMNTRTFPTSYSFGFRTLYRVLLPLLGQSVDVVTTVSNYSKSDLVRHKICSTDKIVVASNGCEHAGRWIPRHSAATRDAAGRDTVVVIGSSAPHKNVALITGLASRLEEVGLRLAVVGSPVAHVFRSQLSTSCVANITWLGRVSDDELAALLRDSLCLAFPSLVEGFGLPALEAMAIGCPVVVSDRASLPEVCGSAAIYASPEDAGAWFKQFCRLRESQPLRQTMIELGKERAKMFRWQTSADRYLRVMAMVDGIDRKDVDA